MKNPIQSCAVFRPVEGCRERQCANLFELCETDASNANYSQLRDFAGTACLSLQMLW